MIRKELQEQIEMLQLLVTERYHEVQKRFYSGEINLGQYTKQRVDNVSLWYVRQLVKIGLAEKEFTPKWIRKMAKDSLAEEFALVPPKKTGLTDEEVEVLCDLQRKNGTIFFDRVHKHVSKKLKTERVLHKEFKRKTREEARKEEEDAIVAEIKREPDKFPLSVKREVLRVSREGTELLVQSVERDEQDERRRRKKQVEAVRGTTKPKEKRQGS